MWIYKKNGIALLITLFFVIAITASVGIGLKQINTASKEVDNEKFMLQTSIILDDVLALLKTSKDLQAVTETNSSEAFFIFLSQAAFIPFESSGMKISLSLKSARSKFNINDLKEANITQRADNLKEYVNYYNVNAEYVDLLLDGISGIKEDMSYNSEIFYEKPTMFRDYITSYEHLEEFNRFFIKKYHDNSLKNIDFKNLFYYSVKKDIVIDLNYATKQTWMMMLGINEARAEELSSGGGSYISIEDISLQDDEKLQLAKYKTSLYEPYIDVTVDVIQDAQDAKIEFEYDLRTNKGTNFVYKI